MANYLRNIGKEHRQTTNYNPQANGKCERFNGTLKLIISKLVNNNRASWVDQLTPAFMAYNNLLSDISYMPYFLYHA